MATWRRQAFLVLLATCLGIVSSALPNDTVETVAERIRNTAISVPKTRPFLIDLSKEVERLTRTHHYSRRSTIDPETSQLWFDEYFDMLDHNHTFFLQADVDEFASARDVLAKQVQNQGRIQFAYDVYERLLERVKQWAEYAADHIDDDFDFSKEEDLVIDRHEMPRAESMDELHEIWRKRLKNSLLVFKIEEAERAARTAKAEAEKAEGKTAEKEAPAAKPETGAENVVAAPAEDEEDDIHELDDPKLVVLKRYERYLHRRTQVEAIDILEIFLTALTHIYDPHSTYMAPVTDEDFTIDMSLQLTGIGARLTSDDGYVKVTDIITGGPAERDGRLKAGDRIIAVGQEPGKAVDVIDKPINRVVQKIRGEKGTTVYLTVLDGDTNAKSVIDIVRDVVKLEDQSAKSEIREVDLPIKDEPRGKIAVIYLPSFYRDFGAASTSDDFKSSGDDIRRLIQEAGGNDLAGVILDLRYNGGGALEEAIAIAGLFFGEGPVVQVRNVRGRPLIRFDKDPTTAYDGPLVVLTDKSSASASEIVAAALQDYHRAVIVGDSSTHGKGTVQQKLPLDRSFQREPQYANEHAGALKLTLAKYYRVTGGSTQLRGVVPDIVLPSYTDYMDMGEAKIPHAMPWDEIQPARFSCDVDVRPYLPELQRRSEERRKKSAEFQDLVANIEHYGERRQRKTLPLSYDSRKKLIEEEEEWSRKLREARSAGKNRRQSDVEEDGRPQPEQPETREGKDLVLDEAVAILTDLIALEHDPTFKAVAAKTPVATNGNDLEDELQ
jgi:carboxyl-terminal processing protease